tara:strand:+ start:486 stop:737 length:252 start_codon:yes stop_codon:yes gene_type:complete
MTDSEARIKTLENEVSELKSALASFGKKSRRKKNDDTKKTPSPYNLFVQRYLTQQKEELGDKYKHSEAFKQAAVEWKKKKESN